MKKPLLIGIGLAVLLVALAVGLPSLRSRITTAGGETPAGAPTPALAVAPPTVPALASPAPGVPLSPPPTTAVRPEAPALKSLGRARLDAQVLEVVTDMDRTGRPPAGVTQGGRRGARRGVFVNAEKRLPVKPSGYYRESDVWPARGGTRGPERLVFGRNGEVYYSPDHYRSFQRLR